MLIALGVTGGIGAYKAVEIARGLQKRGHDVTAIMTRSARRFVGTVTFEAITRRRVITDQFAEGADAMLRPAGTLAGRFVIVTAGPTYEDIDDVRYIGNRSSGKMGYALAAEAARRGARVVLVSGPSSFEPPASVELVRVRSAAEMHTAVMTHATSAAIVVMAAAVADYTPRARAGGKIEK